MVTIEIPGYSADQVKEVECYVCRAPAGTECSRADVPSGQMGRRFHETRELTRWAEGERLGDKEPMPA